jgi:hypothetical protein
MRTASLRSVSPHCRALATLLLWVVYLCAGAAHLASHHFDATAAGRPSAAADEAGGSDGLPDGAPCGSCWLLLMAGCTLGASVAAAPCRPPVVWPATQVARTDDAPPRQRFPDAARARAPPIAA